VDFCTISGFVLSTAPYHLRTPYSAPSRGVVRFIELGRAFTSANQSTGEILTTGTTRRALLGAAAAGGLAGAGLGGAAPAAPRAEQALLPRDYADPRRRAVAGRALRNAAAARAYPARFPAHPVNGDEAAYPYLASYTKGLPHNDLGEVDHDAYDALVRAVESADPALFAAVPAGTAKVRPQLGPQGAYAFELMGADTFGLVVPPAPPIDGAETAADLAELYWMSMLRDVPFTRYDTDPQVAAAAAELSQHAGFRGPRGGGRVTPVTLFRPGLPGAQAGPFLSQFLLNPVPFGTLTFEQLHDTVAPHVDHLGSFAGWLAAQRGVYLPTARDVDHPRYLRNGRDLAHYTHFDRLYQAYLFAALMLQSPMFPARLTDPGNPYFSATNVHGFHSYGSPHLAGLLADVAVRAIKHMEFQQFVVHRRLRPEALAGRIDVHLDRSRGRYLGMLSDEILHSEVLQRNKARFGSYLLTQSYPEGSPMCPSYQSGHCTVAGACVTVLKAWFDEAAPLPDPVVPNADGTALVPYTGPGADRLTVGGELNKLAGNIGASRAFAGVHYRSDNTAGFRLGEEIAIDLIREQRAVYLEKSAMSLTRFDGTTVTL
jgi:hypothetical protein